MEARREWIGDMLYAGARCVGYVRRQPDRTWAAFARDKLLGLVETRREAVAMVEGERGR